MSGEDSSTAATGTIPFPSLEWFERLGVLMDENRARHDHIGPIDCAVVVTSFHPRDEARNRHFHLTFELYSLVGVDEVTEDGRDKADFIMETDLDVWAEMIDNIRDHGGKPDLDHSLNRLSLPGVPIRVWAEDPLGRDMFFRFNQSLQEYVNASYQIETAYPDLG